MLPELNQDKSGSQSSQVCKMGNVISRKISNARKQFDKAVHDNGIFSLDREGNGNNKKQRVWKIHSKGNQYSENSTGRTNHHRGIQQFGFLCGNFIKVAC